MTTTGKKNLTPVSVPKEGQERGIQSTKEGVSTPIRHYIDLVLLLLIVCFGVFLHIPGGVYKNSSRDDYTSDPWWRTGVIYQIYPRSFQDSDSDGIGDLRGIESRLDYVSSLGVRAISLSPIYQSPMVDFGYDISDFENVDPIFGTMEDFDSLLNAIHRKGMFLIMDFVPNHTSNLHRWFVESRQSRNNPRSNYYIWKDGRTLENGTRVPPNNWISKFGGSAWEWSDERGQYYYHQYAKEQPDLNYRNDEVKKEMENVLMFWIRRGVDGIRLDAVENLFEHENMLDEPRSYAEGIPVTNPDYLMHTYTRRQPEMFSLIRSWRTVLDNYEQATGKHVYMMAHVEDRTNDLRHWREYYNSGPDQPVTLLLAEALTDTSAPCDGICLQSVVSKVLLHLPPGGWLSWVVSNHGLGRVASCAGLDRVDHLNMLLLLLPGTPNTYYGEEIGMPDVSLTAEYALDPRGLIKGGLEGDVTKYSRDPSRSPMQWSEGVNSGFSNAPKTWLPVHPAFADRNVEVQSRDAKSTLNQYRYLIRLRTKPAFQNSKMLEMSATKDIFAFVRQAEDSVLPKYLVIINLSEGMVTVGDGNTGKSVVEGNRVVAPTEEIHWPETGRVLFDTLDSKVGQMVNMSRITMKALQGLVLEFYSQGN